MSLGRDSALTSSAAVAFVDTFLELAIIGGRGCPTRASGRVLEAGQEGVLVPRDMFGDVVDPSIKMGNKAWYTVPLTMLLEAAIVGGAGHRAVDGERHAADAAVDDGVCRRGTAATAAATAAAPAAAGGAPAEGRGQPGRPRRSRRPRKSSPRPASKPASRRNVGGVEGGIPGGVVGGITGGIPEAPPPPPPPPTQPVRVGGNIKTPTKIKDIRPVYPPIAQSARVQGVVIIEATIGADGSVQNARVLRSIPLLDAAALDAVKQWEFTPTLLNGVPVPVIMTVTVQFTLQ